MHHFLTLGLLTLALSIAEQPRLPSNPRIGTWTLDLEKSRYEGITPPKRETRTYVAAPDGAVTLTATIQLADGTTQTVRYTAKYDSKDYPYSGPAGDSISIRILDSIGFSTRSTVKKGGRVVQTAIGIVARDGKTMSYVTEGTDAAGKSIRATRIYTKQ